MSQTGTAAVVPRGGIGSDFHSPDLGPRTVPPWEAYYAAGSLVYFSTGRQALYALAEELEKLGYRHLLVPDYFCESMLTAFDARGWTFAGYPLNDDLSVDWDAVVHVARGQEGKFAVLLPRYFVPREGDCSSSGISALQSEGAFVVVDETHTIFDPACLEADAAFASLRKLLPVADGAYLWTKTLQVEEPQEPSAGAEALWAAMDRKRDYLDGHKLDFVESLKAASGALEAQQQPESISARSRDALAKLPFGTFAESRRRNYEVAAATLEQLGVSAPFIQRMQKGASPAFLTVQVQNPEDVQAALAQRGVYCPIHWPEPADPFGALWKRRPILSLPIDQRYTPADIEIGAIMMGGFQTRG